MKGKNVKSSPIIYKLFKFEGMLAQKNFKRNRKKYRTTVISLVLSLVLFMSASSLCYYFNRSFTMRVEGSPYDVSAYVAKVKADPEKSVAVLTRLGATEGVSEFAVTVSTVSETNVYITDSDQLTKEYLSLLSDVGNVSSTAVYPTLTFVSDEAFNRLCLENGLNKDKYYDKDHPLAILYDHYVDVDYDNDEMTRTVIERLNRDALKNGLTLKRVTAGSDTLFFNSYDSQSGNLIFTDVSDESCIDLEADEYPTVQLPLEGNCEEVTYDIGCDLGDSIPYFSEGSFCLFYPYSMLSCVAGENADRFFVNAYYVAPNHAAVYEQMKSDIAGDNNDIYLTDASEDNETIRALMTLIKVFSYGFIVLISLIAAANVFNTISTNISLRRRELAMLKSVGLSERGLNRMMNYESLLYGLKSLLFGLPLSLLITYGIYMVVSENGFEMSFTLPWGNLALGVFSVFAVVFASMLYSVKKLKRYNTADELKNENI